LQQVQKTNDKEKDRQGQNEKLKWSQSTTEAKWL